jgi:hypothetical protein
LTVAADAYLCFHFSAQTGEVQLTSHKTAQAAVCHDPGHDAHRVVRIVDGLTVSCDWAMALFVIDGTAPRRKWRRGHRPEGNKVITDG